MTTIANAQTHLHPVFLSVPSVLLQNPTNNHIMNPGGPQQFNLQVVESSFPTYNPALPIVGLDILADIRIIIKWDEAGTGLTKADFDTGDPAKDAVTYDQVEWQSPGDGPFDIYENVIGGNIKKVGTVKWSLKPQTYVKKQVNPATNQKRFAITPTIELIRTVARTGALIEIKSVYTAGPGGPQYGNWS